MASWYYLNKAMRKGTFDRDTFNVYENLSSTKNPLQVKVDLNASSCRICLRVGTLSVYESENMTEITNILNAFDIEVNENDGHPKFLCETCNNFLNIAILFKRTAKKSEEIFKQSFKEEVVLQSEDSNNEDYDYNNDVCDTKQEQDTNWISVEADDSNIKVEYKDKIKFPTKVTCRICNKVINRSYIKEHVTMHDPDHKKYVCDVCGKSFRLRCAYHNHSLRHRNDFPYKCSFCPYRGRYAELLKTHMRTHTGDYRYMCTECPARFLFKSNLNSHMLKHKEPQFKCETCKRAFHTSLALQRHFEADHLGIKNHVCNVCGKAFGYRNAMMKHQRHVHKREKLLFGRMPSYLQAENKNQNETQ